MKRGVLVLVCIIIGAYVTPSFATSTVTLDHIKRVIPAAASFSHNTKPIDHYTVADLDDKPLGVAFITSKVEPVIRGYSGEIDVLVGMDLNGVVTGISILSHRETPAYFRSVASPAFLDRFVGRSSKKGFDDIDAVTGATVSSDAIKRDIQTAAFEVTTKLIDSGVVRKGGTQTRNPFDVLAIIAAALVVAGGVAASVMPRRRWVRYVVRIASILVIGVWLNMPLTIGMFVDLRHLLIPATVPLIVLMLFALIAPVLRCNLYCAYVCPFGALQEGAHALRAPKLDPDNRICRNASWLRWVLLLATVFAIAAGLEAFRTVEPFALCFSRILVVTALVQAGVVLVAALFIKRPWCRYFCPTGAVLDLLCRLGYRLRRLFASKRGDDEQACS